jgi:hypothetical protein
LELIFWNGRKYQFVTRLETLFPVLDYFVFFMEPKLDCFTAITSKMKEIFTITKSRTIKEKIKIAVFYFDELLYCFPTFCSDKFEWMKELGG